MQQPLLDGCIVSVLQVKNGIFPEASGRFPLLKQGECHLNALANPLEQKVKRYTKERMSLECIGLSIKSVSCPTYRKIKGEVVGQKE